MMASKATCSTIQRQDVVSINEATKDSPHPPQRMDDQVLVNSPSIHLQKDYCRISKHTISRDGHGKIVQTESPPNFIYSNEVIGKYR